MKKVLYLCYNNQYNNAGFLFPSELEKGIYSPGFFIIETKGKNIKARERFFNKYLFLAIEKGEVKKYILRYKKNNIFFIETEAYGEIEFKAMHIFNFINKYVGSRNILIGKEHNFYFLECTNINYLEELCKEKDFYFIGSIENGV